MVATGKQPRRQVVIREGERWLSTLDWESERAKAPDPRPDAHHIALGESHLFLAPWRKAPENRGKREFPTVVTGPTLGGVINEPPALVDDLRDKARAYGELDWPFVIAALALRDFTTSHDFEQALYGPEVVTVPLHGEELAIDSARVDRDPQGLWQRGEEQRATRVSGVLTAVHLVPWSVAKTQLCLWRNPWAARPLTLNVPWATVDGDLDRNELTRQDATQQPHELIDLPSEWPGL